MAENTELAKAEEKKEVAHSNNKVTDYSLGIYNRVTSFHGIICAIHVASRTVWKFCFYVLHLSFLPNFQTKWNVSINNRLPM